MAGASVNHQHQNPRNDRRQNTAFKTANATTGKPASLTRKEGFTEGESRGLTRPLAGVCAQVTPRQKYRKQRVGSACQSHTAELL
ncbi:hypothetical protein KCP70_11585 [Salmonella enterica subsp. enterica]|nr:hypothetical protein KCP70_11585 [Salmonella enterica subsp. enterica]